MLTSKTLLSPLNALFAKVHHPPPIDKRSSQRLLKALTTSFRKNLDKEHGYWLGDGSPSSVPTTSVYHPRPTSSSTYSTPSSQSSSSLVSEVDNSSNLDAHRRPTDRHVRAILSNPLFSYDPSKAAANLAADRDPMGVFDQAVAQGLMSPYRAAGVLMAKRKAIAQSPSISVNDSMAASGTAVRVLQWLRSSGLERDLSFITCSSLVDQLVPFMLEEGLEETAWMWLERWMRGEGPTMSPQVYVRHASTLLTALVRARVSPAGPLNSGYASIIRAGDMFRENPYLKATAIVPWKALFLKSTVFAWQHAQPSEALYDEFAAMRGQLSKRSGSLMVDSAHLELHHPTHPDATQAVRYLKSPSMEQLSRYTQKAASTASEAPALNSFVRRVMLMATDAAQHLMRTGQEAEAEWVGNFVLAKLGDFVREELTQSGQGWPGSELVQALQAQHGHPTR